MITKLVEERVTEEDLTEGARYSCYTCPVALALKRAFPDAELVTVGGAFIFVLDHEDTWYVVTDTNLQGFISLFDQFGKDAVSPMNFTLEMEKIN